MNLQIITALASRLRARAKMGSQNTVPWRQLDDDMQSHPAISYIGGVRYGVFEKGTTLPGWKVSTSDEHARSHLQIAQQ